MRIESRKIAIRNFPAILLFAFLLIVACLTVACGSSDHRRLQSISISAVANGSISFIATGTYDSAPLTVNPLPASWYVGDPTSTYQLTTDPFTIPCDSIASHVTVIAPVDPHAPTSGQISGTKMITASAPIICP